MYSEIKVAEKTVVIRVPSGCVSNSHTKLIGSTFPIVPVGTTVEKLSVKVPDGLQGIAFFCEVEGPREVGSGKTARLDYTPQLSTSVLLSWGEENGKLIVKADEDMSASELAKFNSFVRSDTNVLIVDSERKIAYVSGLLLREAVDPDWTYKLVSMEAILKRITKELTMEQLDEQATSEQRARDELLELRDQNCRLEADSNILKKHCVTADAAYNELVGTLMKSARLCKFLKCIPVKIRPNMLSGFIEAMDSFSKPATA